MFDRELGGTRPYKLPITFIKLVRRHACLLYLCCAYSVLLEVISVVDNVISSIPARYGV